MTDPRFFSPPLSLSPLFLLFRPLRRTAVIQREREGSLGRERTRVCVCACVCRLWYRGASKPRPLFSLSSSLLFSPLLFSLFPLLRLSAEPVFRTYPHARSLVCFCVDQGDGGAAKGDRRGEDSEEMLTFSSLFCRVCVCMCMCVCVRRSLY